MVEEFGVVVCCDDDFEARGFLDVFFVFVIRFDGIDDGLKGGSGVSLFFKLLSIFLSWI